ncbi:MAG: hypothetical protein WA957_05150, partial [Alteraurantiacibacter sp.]
MTADRAALPARMMARVMGVPRSGLHAWQRRVPSDRSVADAAPSERIAGRSTGHDLEARLVIDAMDMAIGQRRPRDVIRHGDQGARHAS